jgi:N-acyl-D-aspartate/D-glutamate deacylase
MSSHPPAAAVRPRPQAAALYLGQLVAALVVLGGCTLAARAPERAHFDTVLRGGTVIDGSGAPRVRTDVGVRGGRIAAVGDLSTAAAATVLDVTGLYVAPGFINLHSHPTPAALQTAVNMLTQGVTLEVLNPDGGGPIDVAAQLDALERAGLALNIAACIGFNGPWREVMGQEDRRPTRAQIDSMSRIIVRNLEAGAYCVSAGLDYKPAYFAREAEVVDVLRPAARFRTVFANHERVVPETNFSSHAGMFETIRIAEAAGLTPLITHMKVQGREQGTADSILRAMAARPFVPADAYPYLAGQTSLAALIIPGWAQEGGRAEMLRRFADPALRARIIAEAEAAMYARFGGPTGVYLPTVRRELTDVMREHGVGAGEAVLRLLEEANYTAILRFGIEADLVKILQYPATSIACDCGAATTAVHPRFFGTYPRVLGRYVREQGVLTWEDAVRKMTSLPAATIGIADRGLIATSFAADIVVFDPHRVIDHATFEEPTRPSEGIVHVLVNGVLTLRDGQPTGARAGVALRRTEIVAPAERIRR